MQAVTRPKLFPPLALLRQAQGSGPHRQAPRDSAAPASRPTLSRHELRRIVADLIG